MKRKTELFLVVVLILTISGSCSERVEKAKINEKKTCEINSLVPEDISKPQLTVVLAEKLTSLPLSCIEKHYPYKPGHVHKSEKSTVPHHVKTPIFSGCFDWHSAVHMHWTLVRLMRLYPDIKSKEKISELLNRQFTDEKVKKEIRFFNKKHNLTFERTYGWAWLMRLHSELLLLDSPDSKKWAETLKPLVKIIRDRTIEYFKKLPKPVRPGTHSNTAFSMNHMLAYADAAGDRDLEMAIETTARKFFKNDHTCPTGYEPGGVDFISPCLSEAYLMSQIMDKPDFTEWLDRFFPDLCDNTFKNITTPPTVTDPKDYVIGHLVGLNFQRAWAYKGIAKALSDDDPRKEVFIELSDVHLKSGLEGMDKTGYGGSHWLASFATLAFTN